ncbi:hypothetical protein Pmani_039553 [Petrolisthes manimaculis]|uniref:Ig-like domain-containing protein n=1 Tax=Petrolisthes manimaculis TaxID=1843537 RepID=A0AAE1TJD7_9EUCA|nr:hypothetical protein Pmani_039553 [Petrolisthes manimaculis]
MAGAFDRVWHLALVERLHAAWAYVDDVTVSVSFAPGDETSTIFHLNTILHRLEIWGRRWQVSFAPHKSHLIVVSRTRHDIRLFFDGAFLTPTRELKILGVTYDDKLTFKPHIMQLARTAAGQLASLRRISWLLDNRGRELLYKAQIRSTLEYSCLAWGGAAPSHIAVLDKVQRRAERIIWDGQQRQPGALQCLQHRRDVAGLTTFFKAQVRRTPHLNQLRQALPGLWLQSLVPWLCIVHTPLTTKDNSHKCTQDYGTAYLPQTAAQTILPIIRLGCRGLSNAYYDHYDNYYFDGTDEREEGTPTFQARSQIFTVEVGQSVIIPCDVDNVGNNKLIIKKIPPNGAKEKLLSVGREKVTRDRRITVEGARMTISHARPRDAGEYLCEFDLEPPVQLKHRLDVQFAPTIKALVPPRAESD